MTDSPDVSILLEQSTWLRGLARRLVADPHQADDLVQDTWVRALESGPGDELPVRGWVATVLRNRAARSRRRDAERAWREQEVSRPERTPSAHEVVERAALHQEVVRAVLELEEPYRATILLRFFEQRSYAEIARRTGTTRATVNSRVTRGLERLRRRLDRAHGGDGRSWALALAPLLGEPSLLELARHGAAQALYTWKGATLMYASIGAATAAALVTTLVLSEPAGEPAGTIAPLARSASTAAPAQREELPAAAAVDAERPAAPAAAPALVDGKRWSAPLFHSLHLDPGVTGLRVSSGAGDLEVRPAGDGMLRVEGKVSVRADRVRPEQLSPAFLDHVEVEQEGGELSLRDRHEGTSEGWNVELTVYVPRALAVTAASGAGDVEVLVAAGRVTASSGAGDVEIALAGEDVEVTATSGAGSVSIEVAGLKGDLVATTGAGDVEVVARRAQPGKYSLTSGAGDTELTLPAGIRGSFDLETGAGDIDVPAELGLRVEEIGNARKRAVGSNGEGFEIRMRTGAGDVEIEWVGSSGRPI